MKRPAALLIRLLTGAGLGFIAGSAAVAKISGRTPATARHQAPPVLGSSLPGAAAVPVGKSSKPSGSLPALEDFQAMSAGAKVELAAGFELLSPPQREALLRECAAWPEMESIQMLRLLMCAWAETDPRAAAEWAYSHPDRRTMACSKDIATLWAARNVPDFVFWVQDFLSKADSPYAMGLRSVASDVLERFDPVARAVFLEMESKQGFSCYGGDFSRSLRTPEAVKAMAAKLPGHIEYISDQEELVRQLSGKSSNPRNLPAKNGWNALFEQTATALHRISPQECGAWLAQFPESAQLVARHEIARVESLRADAVSPSTAEPSNP